MSSAVERKVFKALRPERPATRLLFNWLLLKTSLERLVTWLGLTFPTYFRLDLKNTRLDFFFNCLPWERRAYTACYKRGAARFLFYFRSPTVEHFQLLVIFFFTHRSNHSGGAMGQISLRPTVTSDSAERRQRWRRNEYSWDVEWQVFSLPFIQSKNFTVPQQLKNPLKRSELDVFRGAPGLFRTKT